MSGLLHLLCLLLPWALIGGCSASCLSRLLFSNVWYHARVLDQKRFQVDLQILRSHPDLDMNRASVVTSLYETRFRTIEPYGNPAETITVVNAFAEKQDIVSM